MIHEDITNILVAKLSDQLDAIFLTGLTRKGFNFENRRDTEAFIKTRCRCEDNLPAKQRIFFVDDIPFLLHNYEVMPNVINSGTEISANYGSFKYL